MYDRLAQLDKHQTSKPLMVSCEFNSHWRQLYFLLKPFKAPQCQFCTKISDLCYLWKPQLASSLSLLLVFWVYTIWTKQRILVDAVRANNIFLTWVIRFTEEGNYLRTVSWNLPIIICNYVHVKKTGNCLSFLFPENDILSQITNMPRGCIRLR